jgi:hypothetical protein
MEIPSLPFGRDGPVKPTVAGSVDHRRSCI